MSKHLVFDTVTRSTKSVRSVGYGVLGIPMPETRKVPGKAFTKSKEPPKHRPGFPERYLACTK